MGLVRYDEVRKIVFYSICTTGGIALGEKLAEGFYGVKDKVSEIYHGAQGGEVKKPQGGDMVPHGPHVVN